MANAGIVLVLLASALFGLTGAFTKLLQADAWTILAWRGLAGGITILIYRAVRPMEGAASLQVKSAWSLLLLAFVGTLSSITFIAAFKYTYVANVTVIYALLPFLYLHCSNGHFCASRCACQPSSRP